MPDRLIRTADGVLGGLLIIIGLIYICLGWSWTVFPTDTRVEGISWLPFHVTMNGVGWWWMFGGAVTVAGAALSRWRLLETMAVMAGVGTSLVVAGVFAVGWMIGESPGGLIGAMSYVGWSVIVGWVSVRTSLNHLQGSVTTNKRGRHV